MSNEKGAGCQGPGAGVANMKANRHKEKLSFAKLYNPRHKVSSEIANC